MISLLYCRYQFKIIIEYPHVEQTVVLLTPGRQACLLAWFATASTLKNRRVAFNTNGNDCRRKMLFLTKIPSSRRIHYSDSYQNISTISR
jgi:hypothetical protein